MQIRSYVIMKAEVLEFSMNKEDKNLAWQPEKKNIALGTESCFL